MSATKRFFTIALAIALVLACGLSSAETMGVMASVVYLDRSASLSSSMNILCTADTKYVCEVGLVSCTIYTSTGSFVKTVPVGDYEETDSYVHYMSLAEYCTKGEKYYVVAKFTADDEIKTCTSGTVTYR